VVTLLAPALADLCVLDLRHADGTVERIVAGPDDTTYAALVDALIRCPPNPTQPGGAVATALRTGVAQYEPTTLTSLVDAEALDTDQRAALAGLAPISAIIAPVVARERQHGLLSLLFVGQERRSTAEDLVLAEELARTCALALDNALLYAAERQASASAQALARQREEFLAIAAHELKTPLTTVKGYVQLAGRFLAKPELDRERLLRILATLHVQVGRLEGLVGDLLDVGRLQHGQLALRCERLDLVALARQVLARFETAPERTEQHTLELDAAEPVTGLWDGHRLDQVLTNLLSNALKYSPAGGRVRVSIRHTADGQAEIAVSDQGIGIPPADRPLVFQPFGRGEHGSRQVAGVGLGLYITAQIVARHGGTIDLTSDPGVGSLFVVRLPLVGPAALSWRC
jgi:signal transduction histidine kinase